MLHIIVEGNIELLGRSFLVTVLNMRLQVLWDRMVASILFIQCWIVPRINVEGNVELLDQTFLAMRSTQLKVLWDKLSASMLLV